MPSNKIYYGLPLTKAAWESLRNFTREETKHLYQDIVKTLIDKIGIKIHAKTCRFLQFYKVSHQLDFCKIELA
jgi:hypothetical protein